MSGALRQFTARRRDDDFSPLDIGWHTAFWAEDPDWTPPADGVRVEQWDDATGNGRHATDTSTTSPIYRASYAGLNNQPAVESARNQPLRTASFTALSQPNTIVAIAQFTSTVTEVLFSGIAAGNRHQFWRATAWTIFAGTVRSDGTADLDRHLFTTVWDTTDTLEIDGDPTISADAGAHTLTGITLFGDHVTARCAAALAFFGLYDGVLPSADLAALESWAADHYDLTI